VERLWYIVKWEYIYLMDYDTVATLATGLQAFFQFYNYEQTHQSREYCMPAEVCHAN